MVWSNKYIEIPFVDHGRDWTGCDCYGLGRLALKEECGIELPSLLDVYKNIKDVDTLTARINEVSAQEEVWIPIPKGQEKEFDIIVLRILGLPIHMGIVTTKGNMLHIIDGSNAQEVPYTKGEWANPHKLIGFYRHKELCKT